MALNSINSENGNFAGQSALNNSPDFNQLNASLRSKIRLSQQQMLAQEKTMTEMDQDQERILRDISRISVDQENLTDDFLNLSQSQVQDEQDLSTVEQTFKDTGTHLLQLSHDLINCTDEIHQVQTSQKKTKESFSQLAENQSDLLQTEKNLQSDFEEVDNNLNHLHENLVEIKDKIERVEADQGEMTEQLNQVTQARTFMQQCITETKNCYNYAQAHMQALLNQRSLLENVHDAIDHTAQQARQKGSHVWTTLKNTPKKVVQKVAHLVSQVWNKAIYIIATVGKKIISKIASSTKLHWVALGILGIYVVTKSNFSPYAFLAIGGAGCLLYLIHQRQHRQDQLLRI